MNEISFMLHLDKYIKLALEEDITTEDLSTNAILPNRELGKVDLICKQDGIIAGLKVFERVFKILDPTSEIEFFTKDGNEIRNNDILATVHADARVLLSGERTALNYLQRMSGIATYTRQACDILKGSNTKLLDTRKTTPCMRMFEKYAVRIGGGHNHRFNLSDAVMLKDNHIAAAGGIRNAVEMARKYVSFVEKIEVETENIQMVHEAIQAGADIIMLDNMTIDEIKASISYIDHRAITECSGNFTKENLLSIKDIGIDYVSCGALTHSAPILDLSLKNLTLLQ